VPLPVPLPELQLLAEGLAPALREPVGELLQELLRDTVPEGEALAVPLPDWLPVPEGVPVPEGEAELLPLPLLLPVLEGLAPEVREPVGEALTVLLPLTVVEGLLLPLPVPEPVALPVGEELGEGEGDTLPL